MAEKDSIIVAIELGTTRISGIAGKRKDGNIQVLAYAEEKTTACVKRGIVHNIDKTTQCIKSVISKLKASLKLNISQVYVGLGGQSVRSIRTKVHRNMMVQTYITNEHIDALRTESYEIPYPECTLLENFEQTFWVDSNVVEEPVGVMGTNIEGEYLNVIARRQLKESIESCFNNTDVRIADTKLAAYELAKNVLTDQEKRAGSALVDLGAGTTTVVVYKNNKVRHLVTLPIGFANITQDLTSLQIDENEAEEVKLKYGNAYVEDSDESHDFLQQTYTTSYDRKIKVSQIQQVIEARLTEIILNVKHQISNSNYDNQLLGGLVLTGGGAEIKNIEKAFANQNLKVDKIRIAKTINQPVVKNSDVKNLVVDNGMANSILSLLISGEENCVGEAFGGNDIFAANQVSEERKAQEEELKAENKAVQDLENAKDRMRQLLNDIEAKIQDLSENGKSANLRQSCEQLAVEASHALGESYEACITKLEPKEKYKLSVSEARKLHTKLDESIEALRAAVKSAKEENSWKTKIRNMINEIVNE